MPSHRLGFTPASLIAVLSVVSFAAFLPSTAEAGGGEPVLPEQGLLYASPADDDQRVEFWVVDEGDDDELVLAMSADVRCGKRKERLFGVGDFAGSVDEDGEISGVGEVSSSEPEDGPATTGTATVEGKMTASGGARGTVSVELVQHNEQDKDDVYAECKVDEEAWEVPPGVADPSLDRVEGITPLDGELRDPGYPIVSDGSAAYAVFRDRDELALRKVSLETGEEEWSTEVDTLPSNLVLGDGVVWVAELGGVVAAYSTDDGDEVTSGNAQEVAVGPDGSVWVASVPSTEIVRIDPATGEVAARLALSSEARGGLAAGPAGLYTELEVEPPPGSFDRSTYARIDPTTGAVLATGSVGDFDGQVLFEPDGTAFWINGPEGPSRYDALTLAPLAQSDEYAITAGLAGSRLWLGAFEGVLALDQAGEVVVDIPALFGSVVANGTKVHLFHHQLGLIGIDGS